MRKPLVAGMVLVIVALLVATLFAVRANQQSKAQIAEMESSLSNSREQYAEAFKDIAEIQDSLAALPLGQGPAGLVSGSAHAEERLSNPDRQQALDRISQVNATIVRTKQRIADLESRLHKSGVKTAGLQKLVANLKVDVQAKEQMVAQLTDQVNSLQTQVTGLQTTVAQKQDSLTTTSQTLADRQHELGTVYYVIGSKQQLAQSGVIVAKGGVLGMGKTVTLSGQFNEGAAQTLDTDQETIINAPAAKVRVLSAQPTSSYVVVAEGTHAELRILDAKEFRKVRHVVIMTS